MMANLFWPSLLEITKCGAKIPKFVMKGCQSFLWKISIEVCNECQSALIRSPFSLDRLPLEKRKCSRRINEWLQLFYGNLAHFFQNWQTALHWLIIFIEKITNFLEKHFFLERLPIFSEIGKIISNDCQILSEMIATFSETVVWELQHGQEELPNVA